jgi:radical SAM modification target selenobiotic family peptide
MGVSELEYPATMFLEQRRVPMEAKELKKLLAGLGIATLVSAAGVSSPGHLQAASG